MLSFRLAFILKHLLLVDIRSQLLFAYGQVKCIKRKPYPFLQKVLNQLPVDNKTCRFCKQDNVLMVDDCEWKNIINRNMACYFSIPWRGEMHLLNQPNVIPNICTTLLPFILNLIHCGFVTKFLQNSPMDGNFFSRSLNKWHINRLEQ